MSATSVVTAAARPLRLPLRGQDFALGAGPLLVGVSHVPFGDAEAIEAAIKDAGGNKPTRRAVAEKVRATKDFQGITGVITFDERGDPVKARYFVLKVISANPADWAKNQLVKTLDLAPPKLTPELMAKCGVRR